MQNEWLIISGTSRIGSKSLHVAKAYQQLLSAKNIDSKILALENLPLNIFDINSKSEELKRLEISTIIPAQKIIFVASEYNGSFPGALKMLLDCCDIRNCFWNKKAALVGVSDGRNGNLRGLDHLTGVLNYLKINVLHYKVTIPTILKTMNENFEIIDAHIINTLNKQIEEFEKF